MRIQAGGLGIYSQNGAIFYEVKALLQRHSLGDPHVDHLGIFLGRRSKENFLIWRFSLSSHFDDLTFRMCRNRKRETYFHRL
jgi:hypothetical protein